MLAKTIAEAALAECRAKGLGGAQTSLVYAERLSSSGSTDEPLHYVLEPFYLMGVS